MNIGGDYEIGPSVRRRVRSCVCLSVYMMSYTTGRNGGALL